MIGRAMIGLHFKSCPSILFIIIMKLITPGRLKIGIYFRPMYTGRVFAKKIRDNFALWNEEYRKIIPFKMPVNISIWHSAHSPSRSPWPFLHMTPQLNWWGNLKTMLSNSFLPKFPWFRIICDISWAHFMYSFESFAFKFAIHDKNSLSQQQLETVFIIRTSEEITEIGTGNSRWATAILRSWLERVQW